MTGKIIETKTAVIRNVRQAEIVVRKLCVRKEHDVVIKVLSCNLCTSEFGVWSGARTNKPLPMTFGHEWYGEVIDIGSEVTTLRIGDFVGGSYEYDTYSQLAREGRESEAPGVKPYETTWEDGYYGRYAGCAEYVIQSEESLYRFENKIRPSEAAFLEPLATVVNGLKKLDIKETETIVVIGGGTMGILNALAAKRSGARVIVSEMMEYKVQVAQSLGIEVINGTICDPVAEVKKRTDGYGADTVIVAVGLFEANQQAFDMLKKLHGKILLFAAGYPAPKLGIDTNKIHYGKMSIFGTFAGDYEDFKESSRLLGEHLIDVSALVDKEFEFEDIQEAFEEAVKPGGYRISVRMQSKKYEGSSL